MHNLLMASGLTSKLLVLSDGIRPASEEEILRIHSKQYLEQIQSASKQSRGAVVGDETAIGPGGYEIAALSAGTAICGVESIFEGLVDQVYVLNRPPGHHAEPDFAMGFCIFNNLAIAAAHAQAKLGVERIAIVDYDVHHGNGTEKAFYEDSSVLVISIHQHHCYPTDTGEFDKQGSGSGEGFNINLPLPPGCGGGAYRYVFSEIVLPCLRRFSPDLILVSSGFDACYVDPLGRMMLSSDDFRFFASELTRTALDLCKGRIMFCHEGGYSDIYVPFCFLAVMESISRERTNIQDPLLFEVNQQGYQEIQLHQKHLIDAWIDALKSIGRL
jgi:acetoin utilization deacetylase AcuC-like enzyme